MSGTMHYRGGFGTAPLSDEGRRTVAQLEDQEYQASAVARVAEEAFRAHNGIPDEQQRRAAWEAKNEQLAIRMAIDEGIPAHEAVRGRYGHTPAEFKALQAARMDHEDAVREAQRRRAIREFEREIGGYELEQSRTERIKEERNRAYVAERGPAVMARREAEARRAEIRKIANQEFGKNLEACVEAGILAEGDGRRG